MKPHFRDMSIQHKLTVIIMVTSVTVLLLSSAAFLIIDTITFWKVEKRKLSALAEIIGNNSSAAIAFKDRKAARQTLGGLSANPYILAAYIVTKEGRLFTQYINNNEGGNNPTLKLQPLNDLIRESKISFWNTDFNLVVTKPIFLDGQEIGTIIIQSTSGELVSRLNWLLSMIFLIMAGTLTIAYFLSARLQQIISGPLLRLARTMKAVSEQKDYSLRERKESNDELGILIQGFNEMLTQIQERDEENIAKAEIGRIISSTLDIKEIYERFAKEMKKYIPPKSRYRKRTRLYPRRFGDFFQAISP